MITFDLKDKNAISVIFFSQSHRAFNDVFKDHLIRELLPIREESLALLIKEHDPETCLIREQL